jgi:hypothetical protein
MKRPDYFESVITPKTGQERLVARVADVKLSKLAALRSWLQLRSVLPGRLRS